MESLRSQRQQRIRGAALRVVQSVPGGRAFEQAVRIRRFTRALRRLHRVLADTPIVGRYWMWAGLVLGWARHGAVLPHDVGDADFAFLREDHDRFRDSVPALIAAGFRPLFRFRNGEGRVTQHTFFRTGSNFEFLGRTWLKVRDHERELTALYGDWRTPQTDWRTDRDSPAVIARRDWTSPPYLWDGSVLDE
jgi:hypothetical protein